MPVYSNPIHRMELVAALYAGLRGHSAGDKAWQDLAYLTDVIFRDDGTKFSTSPRSEIMRAVKKHTSLIEPLRPFLLSNKSVCVCGHRSYDHAIDTLGSDGRQDLLSVIFGKCLGKYGWDPGMQETPKPCKAKCAKFELKPI